MAILDAVFADRPGQTPQDIERRRRMAKELLAQSASDEPIRSPWQGVAKIAQALVGGYEEARAEKDDALGRSAANSALINAVYGTSPSSSGSPFTTGAGDAGQTVSGPSKPINMDGNQIYAGFMDTVKAGGVNNPYALAAIAATGKAESGFSPGNANRSWSDPSQSGQAGTAGGIMSWRAERLQNLYNFARAKGEQPGAISPQTQAAFFLQENPALIQRLNSAKSAEEAQRMMNEAWKFAGWDRPGGEAANRLGYANSFLPQFRGRPQQVASLDPSIGMPPQTAAGAVNAMAAGGGAPVSLTDEVAEYEKTPEYAARFPGQNVGGAAAPALQPPVEVAALPVPPNAPALPAQQPQGIPAEFAGSRQLANAQGGIIPALMGGTPASPEQISQARALGAAQPQPQQQGQDNRALIAELLGNPYTAEVGQQLLMAEMQRRQEANDPLRAMQLEEQRLKLDAMRNPQAELPDSVRALEIRAQRAGLQPGTREYNDFMLTGGNKGITVDARQMGNIPPGYQVDYDAEGRPVSMSPIAGSPAATEADQVRLQREKERTTKETAANVVTQDIDRAFDAMDSATLPTTGLVGDVLSYIPGTAARDVSGLVKTIKANATFDKLQAMREASPTGGALGAVSDTENQLLAAAIGNLEQSQSDQQFRDNLARVQNIYLDIIHGPGNGPERRQLSFEEGKPAARPQKSGPVTIDGYTIEEVE